MKEFWYFPRYATKPNGYSVLPTLTRQDAERYAAGEREAYASKKHFQKDPATDLQAIVIATYEKDKYIQVNDIMTGEWFSVPLKDWERMNWHMSDKRLLYRKTINASITQNADGSVTINNLGGQKLISKTDP